jgi:hypothetical protein
VNHTTNPSAIIYTGQPVREVLDAFEVDPETGELLNPERADAAASGLMEEFGSKLDWWADAVREIEARGEARAAEAKRIADLAALDMKRAARIRETIMWAMTAAGQSKIETTRNRMSIQQNGGKRPLDIMVPEDDLPNIYFRTKTETVLDREKLRADLEAGIDVPGACLMERGKRLVIR